MSATEIAQQTGVASALHWQMVIDGRTKLPFSWIEPYCDATGTDPAHVLRIYMRNHMPAVLEKMETLAGCLVLTANERRLIESLRMVTDGTDAQAMVVEGRELVAVVMV